MALDPRQEDLAGRRFLVTGASGFIGSALAGRLVRCGGQVMALSRTQGRLREIGSHDNLTFSPCDLADTRLLNRLVEGFKPDVLFHLASHADGREDFAQAIGSVQSNLIGTINLLEAFRLAGGELFVYGDSAKVYGNSAVPYRESTPLKPNSSYAIAKAAGWQMCSLYSRLHGMSVVSFRPSLIYGPSQPFNLISFVVRCVCQQLDEVCLDGGHQTRDPLYLEDAVDAAVAIARRGRALNGRVVNIGGGHEITILELARLTVELAGGQMPVVCRTDRARPTEIWRNFSDNVEARQMLRWNPRVPLRQGLEKTIAHLMAGGAAPRTTSVVGAAQRTDAPAAAVAVPHRKRAGKI